MAGPIDLKQFHQRAWIGGHLDEGAADAGGLGFGFDCS
jgi:hypothetical protein